MNLPIGNFIIESRMIEIEHTDNTMVIQAQAYLSVTNMLKLVLS